MSDFVSIGFLIFLIMFMGLKCSHKHLPQTYKLFAKVAYLSFRCDSDGFCHLMFSLDMLKSCACVNTYSINCNRAVDLTGMSSAVSVSSMVNWQVKGGNFSLLALRKRLAECFYYKYSVLMCFQMLLNNKVLVCCIRRRLPKY